MSKFTKKSVFVGVDISKDQLDLALMKEESYGKYVSKSVVNELNGFDEILKWMKSNKVNVTDCLFCMEHTGTYGLMFFAWLSQVKIGYAVIPALEIKRSMGITRDKNDQIDAKRIADYAFSNRVKLEPFSLPSVNMVQIKQLLTYRSQLVRLSTSLKNSLKSHKQYQRITGLASLTEDIETKIEGLKASIQNIEKQIKDLIRKDDQLNKNYKLATSVKGIGCIIATFMLVSTNNFTAFENGRKYASYSGVAPFEHSSGTSVRGKSRTSNLANKQIKTLLNNGANSAINSDPELHTYYNRKIAEGKDHKLVINAVSCKLLNRVFATVKRETPYVITYEKKIV
jgi:transposase